MESVARRRRQLGAGSAACPGPPSGSTDGPTLRLSTGEDWRLRAQRRGRAFYRRCRGGRPTRGLFVRGVR